MTTAAKIPFLDLATPHQEMRDELLSILDKALGTAGFIGGPMLESFERDFAAFCESPFCAGVSNGTDALRFALMAAGVQPGDTVVTVPNTFIATTEAISQAGAGFEFVDIDERTYNMDPAKLREYLENGCTPSKDGKLISRRSGRPVRAVVPVHLYGQTADMDSILDLAQRYGLLVIEDACQAHGAQYYSSRDRKWKSAGSMGRAAAFSFYPGKNLGACGEAGAVTTQDPELDRRVRVLRDHGQAKKYHHEIEGYNGRLDSIQAGFLHAKLAHLAKWNDERRARAAEYSRLFLQAGAAAILPVEPPWSRAVHHLYVIRVQEREGFIAHMNQAGIGTGIHYPIPLHLQKAYAAQGYQRGDFPITERVSEEIVSLPMYPQLTPGQQQSVVREFMRWQPAEPIAAGMAGEAVGLARNGRRS